MDWLQLLTATGAVGALGTALATYIKTRPAMKTAEIQGEAALWARIAILDAKMEASDERARLTAEECEKRIDKLEAEKAILRHERNNLRAGFNAFLALTKRLDIPELRQVAETVEDMVTRGDQAIAVEKAAVSALKAKDSL